MPYVPSGTGTVFITGARWGYLNAQSIEEQAGQYAAPKGVGSGSYAVVANQGRIVRLVAERDMTIGSIAFAMYIAAGSDDACTVAIYSSALARLATSATTSGKLNSVGAKNVPLTANVALTRGTVYYLGFSSGAIGSTAGQIQSITYATNYAAELFGATAGIYEFGTMAAAHPLPTTFVRATSGSGPLLAAVEA